MRVIAGRLKGRQLMAPDGAQVRPTADRVKEALFSIIGSRVVGARVLDLYAGTGSLGIEALSRGAAAVTFVEHHPQALVALRRNLHECGLQSQSEVRTCRVETFFARPSPGRLPYDLVLADPPYRDIVAIQQWGQHLGDELVTQEALLVVEHAHKSLPAPSVGRLPLTRTYTYGDTALSIYRASELEPAT